MALFGCVIAITLPMASWTIASKYYELSIHVQRLLAGAVLFDDNEMVRFKKFDQIIKVLIVCLPVIATPMMITMMFTKVGENKGFFVVFYYILNFSQIGFYVLAFITLLLAF